MRKKCCITFRATCTHMKLSNLAFLIELLTLILLCNQSIRKSVYETRDRDFAFLWSMNISTASLNDT
jgi:hypothetical protein